MLYRNHLPNHLFWGAAESYLLAFMIKLCKTTARLSLDASIVYRCCSLAIDKEFMNYKNRFKGAITQVLLKSLLEDASYRIVP